MGEPAHRERSVDCRCLDRKVRVHATLVKRGLAVARCSLEDVQPLRILRGALDVGCSGLRHGTMQATHNDSLVVDYVVYPLDDGGG
ncbi:MAG: hypothetical protein JWO80_2640 [Bryobacterales bacterium]|nr:hypothetical protein [Bryobacterales bacterium]